MTLAFEDVRAPADVRRWHDLVAACTAHDYDGLTALTVTELSVALSDPAPDEQVRAWLGAGAGEVVAAGLLSLPVHDNTSTAALEVYVRPDRRRLGHGAATGRYGLDLASSLGRPVVLAEVWSALAEDGGAPGAFARSFGFRPVLEEVRRVLDLATLDLGQVRRCRDAAADAAPDYDTVCWVDAAPAGLHDDLARLSQLMSTDPPLGEMTWEPEVWDAARWRTGESRGQTKGLLVVGTAAIHRPTGRAVGYTQIGLARAEPEHAYQWATIVEAAHRGHRLGMLTKAGNLELLVRHAPAARLVNTWNAGVNEHMIAINEALGFRPVDRWTEWQLDR